MAKPQEEPKTAAQQKLRDLVSPKHTQAELAEKLGVSQQTVSAWVNGVANPTADRMRRLEDEFGIPMRAWTEAPPVEQADPKDAA
jgi:transcriptional regulator with XRE-family HTH domain